MNENRINTKAFIPYLFSCIAYLASYFVYVLVPSSELANSLEYPGITAVYVLTASPVLAITALALLIATLLPNKDYLFRLLTKPVSIGLFVAVAIMLALSICFSVSFVAMQYKLGFAAPIYGTKWNNYAVYMLISVILQFISMLLVTLKMKGIIKK